MPTTAAFTVIGENPIHCENCERRIITELHQLGGVEDVRANHQTQKVLVTFDPERVDAERIRARLAEEGFEARPDGDNA